MVAVTTHSPQLGHAEYTPVNLATENALATFISSDNLPTKILSETRSWVELTHDDSSRFRHDVSHLTDTMSSSKDSFTRVFILSDILSLFETASEMPQHIVEKIEETKGSVRSTVELVGFAAYRLFTDVIAPFFKNIGFVIADISKMNIIPLPSIFTEFADSVGPFIFISAISDAYSAVSGFLEKPHLVSKSAKMVEKVADLLVHIAAFFFAKEAALILFLVLSTTKLTAKVAGSFFKKEEATQENHDPALSLNTPKLG